MPQPEARQLRPQAVLRQRRCGADHQHAAGPLRALACLGLCAEQDDGRFAATALVAPLADAAQPSVRAWALWWGRQLWPLWGDLLGSVRSGRSVRERAGGSGYAHLDRDPRAAALFNRAMADLTARIATAVLREVDFAGVQRVADIGGGYGELLAAVLTAQPQLHGVLFDRPHASALPPPDWRRAVSA
jgi:hypothetical protein